MKICKDCKHFIRTGHSAGTIWYDQHCGAPEAAFLKTIDPQTGEQAYKHTNDLGTVYFDDRPHPYARDINPVGKCPYFQSLNLQLVSLHVKEA